MKSNTWRSLLLAVGVASGGAPAVATDFELSAINGPATGTLGTDLLSGTLRPARYGIQDGARALTVRSEVPVICARKGTTPVSGKRIVVDPNGYFQETSMYYAPPVDAPGGLDAPLSAWVRGSDSAPFGSATFVAGGQTPLLFATAVGARCVELPVADTAAGTATCTGAVDAPDSIFGGEFEAPSGDGALTLSSRVVSHSMGYLTYEHVLSASNGPITDLSLREQFAYLSLSSGQPVYRNSLMLSSGWECEASEGASCGANERQGLGYIRLDSVNLEAGSCLKITATRPGRSDGLADVPFSGRLFTAAFYKSSVGSSYVDSTATTRVRYVQ